MRSAELLAIVTDLVQIFGTADAALDAVQHTPAPRKKRSAKKLLKKLIRTYKHLTEQEVTI